MMVKKTLLALSSLNLMLVIACVSGTAVTDRMLSTPGEPTPFTDSPSSPTPEPILDPTQTILSFYVEPEVPGGIWDSINVPAGIIWAEGNIVDAITLGLADHKPEGQVVLAEIEWVFTLVAPFKTIQDEVSLADLQVAWRGNPQGSTSHLSSIAVYERDYASLSALLGGAPGGDVINQMVHLIPDDTENISDVLNTETWAVIPFEQLHPEVKVISVNGLSPLDENLTQQAYALLGHYALYTSPATVDMLSAEQKAALIAEFPATNRDPNKMTSLVMTGVTALVRATAYVMETRGILYPARDIGDWLNAADITHISNEVSFSTNCPYPDPNDPSLSFCSNPDYLSLLDFVGADVIELTGNHNNDASRKFYDNSFEETLAMYAAQGMLTFGGGLNLEDAMQPALFSHHGNKLAFLGCNAAGPDFAWASTTSGGAAPCGDFVWLENAIRSLRQEGYLPVVTLQYFEDYSNDASPKMKEEFRAMAAAGAVIVNGSQAHRPKEMEILNGSLIHYGLGNLFFDQMSVTYNGVTYTQTRNEFIQRHVFYDGRYLSTQLLTAVLEDWAKPRSMSPDERQVFLDEIFSIAP